MCQTETSVLATRYDEIRRCDNLASQETTMNARLILTSLSAALFVCGIGLLVFYSSARGDERTDVPTIKSILRDAGRIATLQDEHQRYWVQRVLLWIGGVQQRAGDFDGRNAALIDLANGLAAAGQHEKALEVLHELGTTHGWQQDPIDDSVRLHWMTYLISSKDLQRALKANAEIASNESRPEGFTKLAVAYAKLSDTARSDQYFRRAVEATAAIPEEFLRAKCLWEIADAQMELAQPRAAVATIGELVKVSAGFKEPWVKMCALREAAVRTARSNDRQAAARLFGQALDAGSVVNDLNIDNALGLIAVAQGSAGYFDEALATAHRIKHTDVDLTRDAPRDEAIYQIAIAQAKQGDISTAKSTALSIKYYTQYQEDAFFEIAHLQLEKGGRDAALITTNRIEGSSRKAIAVLKIASAAANLGDQRMARTIAGQIQLKHENDPIFSDSALFDYKKPETWGIEYESMSASTGASRRFWTKRAAEVAAAAMTLAQTLHEKPDASYANAFATVWEGEIIEAMARAHAAKGDAKEALAWARQIGSAAKIPAGSDNFEKQIAVEQRIYALVGVAEGMLDKRGERERAR
jgi:tetratricopeptide (TPR) repeat protein